MYSGLMPIDMRNSSRALFFIYQPKLGEPVDEVTIWLNGGPGCSSMESFLQETGRFLWQPGTYAPVENPYSWVNLTNVLWLVLSNKLDCNLRGNGALNFTVGSISRWAQATPLARRQRTAKKRQPRTSSSSSKISKRHSVSKISRYTSLVRAMPVAMSRISRPPC